MKPFVSRARGAFSRVQKLFCVAVGLLTLAGTATAANDIQSERIRRVDNTERLGKMYPWARPKVAAVISDMEAHGYRPLIDPQVWRSPSQQAALKKRGVSSVGYSFHMVTDRDARGKAKPAALAADIIDKRWAWNSGNEFWLKLASSAQAHGMVTGIRWGLPNSDRAQIGSILKLKLWKAKFRRGWDPAHVEPQPQHVTLHQARLGKRPPLFNPHLTPKVKR